MLSDCSGSRPPIAAPGVMPQSNAMTARAARVGSWMAQGAKAEALLYASQSSADTVWVFSYPHGRKVGELVGIANPQGLCSDTSGNVYVTSAPYHGSSPSAVYEYAHAGTSPIKTFADTGSLPSGCGVDPSTGDLAVANSFSANIAIFQSGSSNPKRYTLYNYDEFLYCTYDDQGNLYASAITGQLGEGLLELPSGGGALEPVNLSQSIGPNSIQWTNNTLAVATTSMKNGVASVYPVEMLGDYGKVGTPTLLDRTYHRAKGFDDYQYWIQGGTIIGPASVKGALLFWKYPQGGSPIKSARAREKARFEGETVSVAAP
jgi:hypothetical protein